MQTINRRLKIAGRHDDLNLYAYEPHTWVKVDGWGPQGIELGMGQIVVVDADGLHYLNRSQKQDWHVVR